MYGYNVLCIFAVVGALLIWAKGNPTGFNIIWRYFSWANETTAVFAFAMVAVYMKRNQMPYLMAVIPGTFYMYIVSCYILNAKIGFNIPWTISYILAGVLAFAYLALLVMKKKMKAAI